MSYRPLTLNPFATAPADWLEGFLLRICAEGLSPSEVTELQDQLEALVPAALELRDGGHMQLNAAALISLGSLDGFTQLANDARLSDLSRQRCAAIRTRLVVRSVRSLLGNR